MRPSSAQAAVLACRYTVWSMTSVDEPSRQPNGPPCKRLKMTALHSVTATQVPSCKSSSSSFKSHVTQGITWP